MLVGPRIHRSTKPARWYAASETVIGVWSLALALLFDPVSGWLLNLIGPQPSAAWHWAVAFCGTFLLLLPATASMGATLPAMQRIFGSIPALYAANTFGAVLGVLGAAFWLVPQIGLVRTAIACAVLNFTCALLAIMPERARQLRTEMPKDERDAPMTEDEFTQRYTPALVYPCAASMARKMYGDDCAKLEASPRMVKSMTKR